MIFNLYQWMAPRCQWKALFTKLYFLSFIFHKFAITMHNELQRKLLQSKNTECKSWRGFEPRSSVSNAETLTMYIHTTPMYMFKKSMKTLPQKRRQTYIIISIAQQQCMSLFLCWATYLQTYIQLPRLNFAQFCNSFTVLRYINKL
jgi:hypothetical protein